MPPETRYAKSGDVHIAYQVFGDGPVNLVVTPPFVSNVEHYWELPEMSRWLLRVGNYARVAIFDKRGTGMSDRAAELPNLDERIDDLRAVMDAAGMAEAALLGFSEGGALAALFAATYPERSRALVLYGSYACDADWRTNEQFERALRYAAEAWGSGNSLHLFVPSRADDPALLNWWRRLERLGASPKSASDLARMNRLIDVTGVLHAIKAPTLVIHRAEDRAVAVACGRVFAKGIPGARFVELPGEDHIPVGDNSIEIADHIGEFLTGAKAPVPTDSVLATVLFTDIVESTQRAAALGDARWRELLNRHHALVRRNLTRFRGREVKTTGDGFLAVFDGPARGVRCARTIADEVKSLGIEVRAGLHTGECAVTDEDDYSGLAVHIGARVAALAGPSEVLVSSTVKDLVAGSGLEFVERGNQALKGVPGEWRIYAASK
jgi:class 3 adenylate cyclase/pimeloyl-ACP methyl ester carboxylesterase